MFRTETCIIYNSLQFFLNTAQIYSYRNVNITCTIAHLNYIEFVFSKIYNNYSEPNIML